MELLYQILKTEILSCIQHNVAFHNSPSARSNSYNLEVGASILFINVEWLLSALTISVNSTFLIADQALNGVVAACMCLFVCFSMIVLQMHIPEF